MRRLANQSSLYPGAAFQCKDTELVIQRVPQGRGPLHLPFIAFGGRGDEQGCWKRYLDPPACPRQVN